MKLLALLVSVLFVGCSVGVSHRSDEENHDKESSTVERSRTSVGVGLLDDPSPPTAERSKTTVKEIRSHRVVKPHPAIIRRRSISVKGDNNTIVLGDLHIHRHNHIHVHETPKPVPVRVDVRVELGDRINQRERRRRMVERRILKAFPHYRD